MGKGTACTLHQNFLLPISHNLEQDEGENAVDGACSNEPTLVPQEEDAFLANQSNQKLTRKHTSLTIKAMHELVNPELTGLTSLILCG